MLLNHFKKIILVLIILEVLLQQSASAKITIAKTGDIIQVLVPSIAYGTTWYLDDLEGRSQFYKSFTSNMATTYALKYTIGSKRPNGGKHSFPSGHTSASFQGASFIHKRYGLRYAIPAYIAATFVGYSRFESYNHHKRDIIAGAAIGILNSFYFTSEYKGITIKPTASDSKFGITFIKEW